MFSATTSACMGFSHAPTISLTALLVASPDHRGYFRYRVLCALGLVRREWAPVNICSPSPANHNRAPWSSTAATVLPQGHSGKSGSQRQVGHFTGTRSLGCTRRPQGSSQVRFSISMAEYCAHTQSLKVSLTLTCRVPSNSQELLDFMRMHDLGTEGFATLKY